MTILTEPERCARRRKQTIAFCCAMLNCLCAGSLLLFSLWAPIFQDRLGFSQIQINGISIAGALGMYLPVPIFGHICDRYGPAKLSLLSSVFFGPSYLLAAHAFHDGLPFYVMLIAFVFIGCGTSSMYFAGVTTCAKNFTGNSRGIALALPIAAFGLSSLWEAQFVSRMFGGDGGEGDAGCIQVGRAFVFFAGLLTTVGVLGGCGLTIVPELKGVNGERAQRDVEEEGNDSETTTLLGDGGVTRYGTDGQAEEGGEEPEVTVTGQQKGWFSEKTWGFLTDRTMWWFAAGVFLVTGPGESFINNMGTLIRSLYPPDSSTDSPTIPLHPQQNQIDTTTHVSIIALTSTIARLVAGSMSDYLAPTVPVGPPPPNASAPGFLSSWKQKFNGKPTMSRMYLLIAFAGVMCWAQLFVAFGGVDQRADRFWMVSGAMGAGYGAVFTLAPTIVSVVWGVTNFGTNWGIIAVTPAVGATLYGVIFAMMYDSAAKAQRHVAGLLGVYYHQSPVDAAESSTAGGLLGIMVKNVPVVCYGKECYDVAFGIMGLSVGAACLCWLYAWRGRGGWVGRLVSV